MHLLNDLTEHYNENKKKPKLVKKETEKSKFPIMDDRMEQMCKCKFSELSIIVLYVGQIANLACISCISQTRFFFHSSWILSTCR